MPGIEDNVERYMASEGDTSHEPVQQEGAQNTATPDNQQQPPLPNEGDNQQQPQQVNQPDTTPQQPAGQQQQPGSEGTGTQPSAQQVGTADPAVRQYYPEDEHRNLIDPRTKQIIAHAGNERRYFEIARNNHLRVRELTETVEHERRELEQLRATNTLPQQLGLSNDELQNAARFMAHWKRDTPGAVRNMLAEALAMGHTIEGLQTGVDTAAIQRMMDQRLQPFNQERETAQRQQQQQAEAAKQVGALFDEHPWAEGQQTEIIAVMDRKPELTMREAALMVQSYAYKEGFDLSRSIGDQIRERNAGGVPQQPTQPVQQQVPQQRPNMARSPVPAVGTPPANLAPTRGTGMSMDARSSTRDIVRDAMREHGISFQE